ncbi:hypothetical protein BHE18_19850 [Rossellomorea aquimaris]|uniref:Uncharacterized protein n=1 Tax=Rossellomorea aquimaris TaxID=189382 RepID=A0A1J6WY04_9BACI|nr:hypothetical protein BHE18_19850 [Rossellomorea aquimaris]
MRNLSNLVSNLRIWDDNLSNLIINLSIFRFFLSILRIIPSLGKLRDLSAAPYDKFCLPGGSWQVFETKRFLNEEKRIIINKKE